LNNGDGAGILGGGQADFVVILTDGTSFNVSLTGAQTIQDVINDITNAGNAVAPGRISVFIDTAAAESLVLQDLNPTPDGQLQVVPLNNSLAADGLGLPNIGSGAILHGDPITNVSDDLLVILTDGTRVDIDLSGLTTLQDVIDAFHAADPRLIATVNA